MRRVSYNLILAFCSVLAIFLLWKGAVAPGKLPDHVFSPEPSENAQHESFSVDAPGMPIESLSAESHLDTQDEPVTPNAPDRMIVIGRLSSENVDWVAENLQEYVLTNVFLSHLTHSLFQLGLYDIYSRQYFCTNSY